MRTEPIEIVNKLGLHARAAAKLVDVAKGFEARIELLKGAQKADAKRIMAVLVLEAPKGTLLELQVDGPDEDAALSAVRSLFADRFGEGE